MPKQTYTCGYCGCTFEDYASNRTKGNVFYCSRKCKGRAKTAKAIASAPVKTESRCSTCGETKPVIEFYPDKGNTANGGIGYICKGCTKEAHFKHYDAHRDKVMQRVRMYQRDHPGRKTQAPYNPAHRKLNLAVEKGRIVKATQCQECGKEGRLHGHHHHGYDNPLDVIWLCPSCHHAAHGRGPKVRAEKKGSPRIDYEDVIIMRKPATE